MNIEDKVSKIAVTGTPGPRYRLHGHTDGYELMKRITANDFFRAADSAVDVSPIVQSEVEI